jgi:hypothetical protein
VNPTARSNVVQIPPPRAKYIALFKRLAPRLKRGISDLSRALEGSSSAISFRVRIRSIRSVIRVNKIEMKPATAPRRKAVPSHAR